MELAINRTAEQIVASDRPRSDAARLPVLVRELSSADRERLLTHFLALDEDDRLLRFGQIVQDHVIERYVRNLNFSSDVVFGVFGNTLELIGVGHLAYLPAEGEKRTAEFGVSVLESARGRGVGSKLFERAAMRSRNTHVSELYMHCLSRNRTMMHIAKEVGHEDRIRLRRSERVSVADARRSDEHHGRNASGTGCRVRLRDQASGASCIAGILGVHADGRRSLSAAAAQSSP